MAAYDRLMDLQWAYSIQLGTTREKCGLEFWLFVSQNEKRRANCICLEKFACVVIFPKLLLPKDTFGP